MRPTLAGTELPQVQELTTSDLRAVAEHKAPGKDGSMLQNLGRAPTAVTVRGVATDPASLDLVEQLKTDLRTGQPVAFVADITTDTTIEQVLIDDLQVRQLAGRPDRYAYVLTLREYVEPVEPESSAALDADIAADAGNLTGGLLDGLDIAVPFATGLDRFVTPLTDMLSRLQAFRQASSP
ncbi:MAG TPA: DNA circularization N-terminal domain-containing protein [Cellulomonas sp.]